VGGASVAAGVPVSERIRQLLEATLEVGVAECQCSAFVVEAVGDWEDQPEKAFRKLLQVVRIQSLLLAAYDYERMEAVGESIGDPAELRAEATSLVRAMQTP
jgi:hypothetical protein